MNILEEYLKEKLPYLDRLGSYINLSSVETILEVGSCEAEDTIKMVKLFPKATIHCFEPLEKNIARAKSNLKKYASTKHVVFNQAAVSNKVSTATFYVSEGAPDDAPKDPLWDYGNKSSSLLAPTNNEHHAWLKFQKKIQVPTVRLDEYLKSNTIQKVDFIHMDVQGAELDVLKGLGKELNKVSAIWLEVESAELYKDQPLEKEIDEFMKGHGFTCVLSTVGKILGDKLYVQDSLLSDVAVGEAYEPEVSVVMSVYNSEKYLKKAMESICAQTFTDFEFIIINDGSTDTSLSIIESYSDKRIRLVNRENWGLTASLNQGIEIARGRYIARMDSDDISTENRFETEVDFLNENPDVGLVGSNYTIIDEETEEIRTTTNVFTHPDDLKSTQVICNQYGHGSIMMRTDIARQLGGYDESVGHVEDYDLWTRISRVVDIANIQDSLYLYRSVPTGVTLKNHELQIRQAFAVRDEAFIHFLMHRRQYRLFSWNPGTTNNYSQKKAALFRNYAYMYRRYGHPLKALTMLCASLILDRNNRNTLRYVKHTLLNRPIEQWEFEFL